MIDLFNSQYKEEIDFIKDNVEIRLNLPNKFLIVAMCDYGHVYLKDEFGVEVANKTSILYGGSVSAQNANEIFAQPDIDGGLIGGAALKIEDFSKIIEGFN